MSADGKNRVTSRRVGFQEWLSEMEPANQALQALRESKWELDLDPEFVAESLKAQFVQDVCRVMEEVGMNKNTLAAKTGKHRQYITRVLNETANFTITSMAAISCALGRKLELRLVRPGEQAGIRSNSRTARGAGEALKKPENPSVEHRPSRGRTNALRKTRTRTRKVASKVS